MSGGGSQSNQQQQTTQNVNQTSTRQLTPEQQQLINLAMPGFEKLGTQGIQLPTTPMTAGFTPAQVQGQGMVMGAATGPMSDVAGSAARGSQFLTSGDVLRPGSNPALQEYINAATLPIEQQLTETTLPDIRMAEVGAGQTGGTRGEIAEGLAAGRAAQAEGLTAAQIANQGYLGGLSALTQGLATSPAVAAETAAPGAAVSAVGDVQQQQQQAQLDEQTLRAMFPQLAPAEIAMLLSGAAAGLPGGGISTTGTTTGTTTGQTTTDPGLASLILGGTTAGAGLAGSLLGKGGLASLAGLFP